MESQDNNSKDTDLNYRMAAALGYDIEKDKAPRVLARGRGEIAQKIVEKARDEDIPIQRDEDIVKVLVQMELGQEIPPRLYEAVAEIMAFIYSLED